ncbi:EamA family transporter [Paenibacillus polymyxa]|uniref:EamA family transporter n=1 Tax=Paenibacillus polymyxa TaxID=1406 RepID=UPI0029C9C619|nr:EamA family transporter [Paenibacillus polymyxa]
MSCCEKSSLSSRGCIPVSTLLLSYIILRDSFSFAHLAGAGFVFLGIMLISRGERR